MSRGTVCSLGLVFVVHLLLFVGVAVANVEVDMVAGVVRYIPWDGVQVATCVAWGVQLVSVLVYPRGLVYLYWLRTWALEVWHIDQYSK